MAPPTQAADPRKIPSHLAQLYYLTTPTGQAWFYLIVTLLIVAGLFFIIAGGVLGINLSQQITRQIPDLKLDPHEWMIYGAILGSIPGMAMIGMAAIIHLLIRVEDQTAKSKELLFYSLNLPDKH